ncbi:energy transducer TonB [Erwinia rhapontici]|uniref:energy transducer TonB n=1 Tax=Erwinia rhapontici TaxID=55212 RepID=UPI003BA3345B
MQGVLGPASQQDSPLWLTGGLLALALHGGLAVWWMWTPPPVAADDAPPAAIMIEIADTAQAVQTQQNNITTEKVDAQASQAQNKEEAQSDGAATPAQAQPQPSLKEPEKPLPVVEKAVMTQSAARASKSKKDEQRRAQQKRQRQQKQQQEQQREQAASAQSVQAQVQAQQALRNAARQTVASNGLSPQQRATWMSKVMAHLEKRKRYPQAAQDRGQQGVATVEFTLDGQGNIQTVALRKGVGFSALDNEVLSLLRRASPVPAPPDGEPKRLTAQIQFFPRS